MATLELIPMKIKELTNEAIKISLDRKELLNSLKRVPI